MASDAKGTLPEDSDRNRRPALERLIHDHGRIDILFSMDRSHGGSRGGLYEDKETQTSRWRELVQKLKGSAGN